MNANHILDWNARGLNSRARCCSVVRDIVALQRTSAVCLQESKVADFSVSMNIDITVIDFDYISLPAIGIAGGLLSLGVAICGTPHSRACSGYRSL